MLVVQKGQAQVFKQKIILIPLLSAFLNTNAMAGGAAGGGASEVTQVMNNGELIASVSKQSQIVAGQIRDYTVQMNQLANDLQNLKNVPVALVAKALKPYKSTLKALGELYVATNEVHKSSTDAFDALQRRRAEMRNLNMTPTEYLNAEALLAHSKGGVYKAQADRDISAFKKAEEKSVALAAMESQISAVGGNVEGLQLLAQQNQIMAGELMEMNAQIREKSLQDNIAKQQQQAIEEENKKREIALREKAQKSYTATQNAINSGKYDVEANRKRLLKDM